MLRQLLRSAIVAAIAAGVSLFAQSARPQDLGIGKLLVAHRDAPDPTFAGTVILLVRYEKDGTLGLVINRRTKVPISRALEGLNGAKQRPEPVYLGGPVEQDTVFALLRANTMPDGPAHVSGKIYLATAQSHLEKALAGSTAASDLRVYLGYSGWDKEQLESEVKAGVWTIVSDSADLAFDPEPDTLWSRLVARGEQQFAGARPLQLMPAFSFR